MKNIKVSDNTHKDIIEWCQHKEIKIVDIIDKLINIGLNTEKYGLSFFQTIIEKEGYISKNELQNVENKLKEKFFDKGHKKGYDLGIKEGLKQFQKQHNKLDEIKSSNKTVQPIEKKIPKLKEIPQYDPDDIYGEEKNTRFVRLEQKRIKK